MKKICFTLLLVLITTTSFSQSFNGKGDKKFQVGATVQKWGQGITGTYDVGAGQNISFGVSSTYLLGVDENIDADFLDRFDVKARFNAHLQNVLNVCDCFDVYPGLNIGLRNFGGHGGVRYFFNDGIGVFAETVFPIAKYDNDDHLAPEDLLNNQFTFTFGLSFNL